MYSLTTPEQKKRFNRRVYSYFSILALQMTSILLILLIFILTPSYVLVRDECANVRFETQEYFESFSKESFSKKEASLFSEGEYISEIFHMYTIDIPLVSHVRSFVYSFIPPEITITSFSYERKTHSIVLEGRSNSRETLVSFLEKLQDEKRFEGIPRITEVLAKDSTTFRLQFFLDKE
jgi:hypothetical protein